MSYPSRGFLTPLLALLFVGLIALAVAGYAMGWLTIGRSPERTTIEIHTQGIEDAAEAAQQEGAELMEKTGEQLRESGAALEESADSTADENETRP